MDADKELGILIGRYGIACGRGDFSGAIDARKALEAHVSAAVQEAESKYQWLCQHVQHVSIRTGPTSTLGLAFLHEDTRAQEVDAMVTARMPRSNHPQETEQWTKRN